MSSRWVPIFVLLIPFGSLALAEEDPTERELPVFAEPSDFADADACGGKVVDLTEAEAKEAIARYHIRPTSEVLLVSQTATRTTSRTYDTAKDGTVTPTSDVKLESVGRERVTTRFYSFIDEDGVERSLQITCSLACSGYDCSMSGCTPSSATNCSAFTCRGRDCTGTCTKTSSNNGPSPNNKY